MLVSVIIAAVVVLIAPSLGAEQAAAPSYEVSEGNRVDARTFAGWQALRQLDCARCHGADYQGSVGPSLLDSVRTRSREDFLRLMLDGIPERGMPPYQHVVRIRDNAAGIYAYFKGRADQRIPAGVLKKLD